MAGDADVGPKSCRIAGLQEMGKTSTTQSPVTLRAALRYLPLSTWCCAPAPPSMPPPIPNCEQLTATSGAQTACEIMAHDRYPASIHTGGNEVRLLGGPWAGIYLLGASKGAQRQPSASHSSNSVPKPPSRGPPPDSSQCPLRLAGAAVTTEMAADRAGSMPYLSDHAAAAVGALTELSAARQSAPR